MMKSNHKKEAFGMTTTAQKWGNSIGVRIPQKIAKKYGISNGSEIKFIETDKGLILEPVEGDPTLDELLSQVTEENKHEEYFAKSMGKELL
ncbi:AbrB/MazE/SpoVT family DNA-binding domain-containing protein [Oceanobacillus sojae]|uniref:AbrB/MazE/SpoVT family DNA-binding domain-containing protein n=1 Tax=Oceanobacillus sojae TaxID=582851 RepID=UPI0021A7F9EA|nr:AbrB/MazE/SpoVT family DNA-binding domain-containing protein [Oceanobacillus sojae]MCT1902971.1 AbrB/MazE/SpoVT family DNA-binding domain-containing protein [Oceanobacillus sojae]